MKKSVLAMACMFTLSCAPFAAAYDQVVNYGVESGNDFVITNTFWDDNSEYLDVADGATSATYSFDFSQVSVDANHVISNPYLYLYFVDETSDDGLAYDEEGHFIVDSEAEAINIFIKDTATGTTLYRSSSDLNFNEVGQYYELYFGNILNYISETDTEISFYVTAVEGDITLYDAHAGGEIVEKPISSPVPEPATMVLFGAGLSGLAMVGRKKSCR